MNTLKKILLTYGKWIIAFLAVANLVLLFIFDYHIPFLGSRGTKVETITSTTENDAEDSDINGDNSNIGGSDSSGSGESTLQLHIPSDALTYDGTSNLDLLNGVVVSDASGTERSDIQVFTTIKSGSSRKEKIIEYSVTDENGQRVAAERQLNLGDNYTGPKIEVLGDMPVTSDEEMVNLMTVLISNHLIQADDGFGLDITDSVSASVKSEADTSGNAIVTLSVTNIVNDSYAVDVNVPTVLSGPTIKLTTDRVTLQAGDSFSFYNYIEYARDDDGTDLSRYISVEGTVDTYTPGEYTLEFFCNDTDGNISDKKTLTVIVQ